MKQNEGWVNDIAQQIVEDESIIREKLLKEAALGGHRIWLRNKDLKI